MRPGGLLSGFLGLVVADASVISLHKLLAEKFPACRSSESSIRASLKLYLVMSVFAASPRMVQLFSERTKELKMLKVGKWVAGRLLLFDLGYYMFSLFERISRNGGFYISRAKDNLNPVSTANNITCLGRSGWNRIDGRSDGGQYSKDAHRLHKRHSRSSRLCTGP